MRLKNIVDALNSHYLKKHPEAYGWFIGKETIEPTKINIYKQLKAEIFYHIPGRNKRVFTVQLVDRCPEGSEEVLKDRLLTEMLITVFDNINCLEKYTTSRDETV